MRERERGCTHAPTSTLHRSQRSTMSKESSESQQVCASAVAAYDKERCPSIQKLPPLPLPFPCCRKPPWLVGVY